MDPTHSMSSSQREFYLPASSVRSSGPGRLERFLTSLRDQAGRRSTPPVRAAVREFYLPASVGGNGR